MTSPLKRTRRNAIKADQADWIWSVLVDLAGAHEDERDAFVRYLTTPNEHGHEWRFIGRMGFGGKLHYNDFRGAQIDCYPEDRSEERDAIANAVNERLQERVPGVNTDA